jgi:F0F1-type ATP synthase gamma subunit
MKIGGGGNFGKGLKGLTGSEGKKDREPDGYFIFTAGKKGYNLKTRITVEFCEYLSKLPESKRLQIAKDISEHFTDLVVNSRLPTPEIFFGPDDE